MPDLTHNYVIYRSYYYESHDKNDNFNNLTPEEWMQRIRDEWTYERLKANHITYIFHSFDIANLHAHGCVNHVNSLTRSNAAKLAGCSDVRHCQPMHDKAQAYRYLLHVTDDAMNAGKHIYDENCLLYSVAPGKKCDYKKLIHMSSEDREDRKREREEDRKLRAEKRETKRRLNEILDNIINGKYGYEDSFFGSDTIYNNILRLEPDAKYIIGKSRSNRADIENAIETRKTLTRMDQQDQRDQADRDAG